MISSLIPLITERDSTLYVGIAQDTRHQPCTFRAFTFTMYILLHLKISASVATFPKHLTMEYGVLTGEASTAVARSQAVRGWGTA